MSATYGTRLERDAADPIAEWRELLMCDECGLPERARDGSLTRWPHPSVRVVAFGSFRATPDELATGCPAHYPADRGASP